MSPSSSDLDAPPLTARSVVLSVLLGAPSDGLAARDVIAVTGRFEISPATTRVALSRLTSAGELLVADGRYRLSERHLRRQRAQDDALHPPPRAWDGSWRTVVVTGSGRGAAERAELRRVLARHRFGELREGVWLRPDTLDRPSLPDVDLVELDSRPADAASLVRRLWDLDAWSATARSLLRVAGSSAPMPDRFVANAAIVRHLRTDPCLPVELAPSRWPADDLRRTYETFRAELADLTPASLPEQPRPV